MPGTTAKGVPYPVAADANVIHTNIQSVATWLDTALGPFTDAQVSAFTAADRWVGRLIYNSTQKRVLSWDGSAWVRVDYWDSAGRTAARFRRAAAQSIPNNTSTAISWDTEDQDTDGFAVAPASTLTIPAGLGGVYSITLRNFSIASGAGGYIYLRLYASLYAYFGFPDVASVPKTETVFAFMNPGNTISVEVYQNSGGAANISGCSLEVVRMTP